MMVPALRRAKSLASMYSLDLCSPLSIPGQDADSSFQEDLDSMIEDQKG